MNSQQLGNPEREVVASYATLSQAQEAVQLLSDHKVDAEHVAITRDVTSRAGRRMRTRPYRLILVGAVFGGLVGALLGTTFGMSLLTIPGLLLGAMIGALIRSSMDVAVSQGAPKQIEVGRHDVVTHPDRAAKARRMLDEGGFRVK